MNEKILPSIHIDENGIINYDDTGDLIPWTDIKKFRLSINEGASYLIIHFINPEKVNDYSNEPSKFLKVASKILPYGHYYISLQGMKYSILKLDKIVRYYNSQLDK